MKIIEFFKLRFRANKYKRKTDRGEIGYLLTAVKQNQVVLDIGAHKAGYLYFLRDRVGDSGRVYAFEPQSYLYNYLIKLKRIFNWDNVTIEQIALSDMTGRLNLFMPQNEMRKKSSPSATIVENKNSEELILMEEVSVDTLDNYCSANNIAPDFVKIDVEGNELKVFRGGLNTLERYKPKILVEIEARHVGREQAISTFQLLMNLGYNGFFIFEEKLLPLSDFSFDKHQSVSKKKAYSNNFIFEFG